MTSRGTPEFRLACLLVRAVLSAAKGIVWEGLENIPPTGPLIVAANHVSMIDPPLVGLAVSRVRLPNFVGKAELFSFPPAGLVFRRIGVIPLDRSRGDVKAVRGALSVLQSGGCMVLFPEGTRSRTGAPGRPKPGVAMLAREARARVLPARVFRTESLFGPGPFTVRFSTTMEPPSGTGGRSEDRAYAESVMENILKI
ncbi:MAG: 1-acyl-sn-glycerol-3-phosphate acyltransferase [Elusimicrobia bacterium]|nr:1-acyl-sn-glycerol-3-phosphate acyltransferase [Elusimicrobiota bacterium]